MTELDTLKAYLRLEAKLLDLDRKIREKIAVARASMEVGEEAQVPTGWHESATLERQFGMERLRARVSAFREVLDALPHLMP